MERPSEVPMIRPSLPLAALIIDAMAAAGSAVDDVGSTDIGTVTGTLHVTSLIIWWS